MTLLVDTLRTGEAAERLGVDPKTVRRLADRGVIRATRLTPQSPRRLLREDVERLRDQVKASS